MLLRYIIIKHYYSLDFAKIKFFHKPKLKLNFLEINEFADMDDDEFAYEKLGEMESPEDEPAARIFGGRKFYLGLIHDEGENTPEEIEELDKIYASIDRETLPESYDSRALGKYCNNKLYSEGSSLKYMIFPENEP